MSKTLLIAICFYFSGCAIIPLEKAQLVDLRVVESNSGHMLEGCVCHFKRFNPQGEDVFKLTTNPKSVKVLKSMSPIILVCKKKGYRQTHIEVGDHLSDLMSIDLSFWPGITGEFIPNKHKTYPNYFVVHMEKNE